MWKRLSTKKILDHPRLKVYEDQIELPNGHTTDYLRFDGSGTVPTVIAINEENKILVIQEYFYVTNEWFYLFPGGFVHANEDVGEGMNRELMEETGFKANKMSRIGNFYPHPRRSEMQAHVYLATDLEEAKLESDIEEDVRVFWFTKDEVDQLIRENQFKNSSSLAAWTVYKAHIKS
jgi:ADP-ribose pyrophosphatase